MSKKNIAERIKVEPEVITEEVKEVVESKSKAPEKVAVVYNCEKLNLRKNPDAKAEIISVLAKNEKLTFKNKVDRDWSHVVTSSGLDGYVMNNYIRL